MLFHIKICGVRLMSDISAVASSGADAIGLNFFAPSIRFVPPADPDTRALSQCAQNHQLTRVGVFVNEPAEKIAEIVDQVGLDVIQLHGDETLDLIALLRGHTSLPILRAIKLPTEPLSVEQIQSHCQPWAEVGCHLLLDAGAGTAHGGSGKTIDWDGVRQWSMHHHTPEFSLAGGLTPENVAQAIKATGTQSVDTASGAEAPRGEKSPQRIAQFAEAALEAWGDH